LAEILFFGVIEISVVTMNVIKLRIDEKRFEFDNVNALRVQICWDQIESLELRSLGLCKCAYVCRFSGSQRHILTMSGMPG
jgi:hypothetical protein